jgi:N-glycosylase/DNA lyase
MENLVAKLMRLKKSSLAKKVNARIREFASVSQKNMFSELCFCLLTANFNAQRCIIIQEKLGTQFHKLSKHQLMTRLKALGHRFPNARAGYIIEARACQNALKGIRAMPDSKAREWLVDNIKGLGMKESSHFLRNIGFTNLAIIDFHIIDLLVRNKMIKRPKTLNKTSYLKIEKILKKLAKQTNLNLSQLDLYLWYLETGKLLK